MNRWFDEQGHLTQQAVTAFAAGELPDEVLAAAAEHIAGCEYCAAAAAGAIAGAITEISDISVPVPVGFAEQTMCKISAQNRKRDSSFALYVLRVAVAACIALVITFSGTFARFSSGNSVASPKAPDSSFVNSVSAGLNDFSQYILNIGRVNNAQKKK